MGKKISISVGKLMNMVGWERAMEVMAECGFDAVDIDAGTVSPRFEGSHMDHDVDEEFLYKFREKVNSLGMVIGQTHGHLGRNFWGQDEESKKRFVMTCERDLRGASILGAGACVIHSISERPGEEIDPEFLHRANLEGYTSIIEYAEKYNVKMALESFGRNKREGVQFFAWPQEMIKTFDAIPTNMKTFCMDTGHTHEAVELGLCSVEDFIRQMGSRIEYLHLHDNYGYYDDHAIPGYGNIKWPEVFKALNEIGFNGYYNFEIGYTKMGSMTEEFLHYLGKYLRKLVENDGDMSK